MAEDSQGTTNPVQVTQDAAMPTAEQQVPEQGPVEQGTGQETAQVPQQTQSEGLPEGVSDRTTKEFEKLREQLRSEREKRLRTEQMFRTQSQSVPQPEPVIDPYTGQVDERLTAIQREAWEAKQQVAQLNQTLASNFAEQERQEAIQKVGPELDSESDQFNEELHDLTTAIIQYSMTNPGKYGNKQISYAEAGLRAKQYLANKGQNVEQIKKQAAVEAIEQLSPKEQAGLEAVGNPGRVTEVANQSQQDLVLGTRKGDLDAVVARIKKIPSVGKG